MSLMSITLHYATPHSPAPAINFAIRGNSPVTTANPITMGLCYWWVSATTSHARAKGATVEIQWGALPRTQRFPVNIQCGALQGTQRCLN